MAEIAVTLALFFVEKVISDCHHKEHRHTQAEVECVKRWLETLQAYLKDNEGQESTALLRNRVKQIRDIAHDIEDVLDEYMLHMPRWIHRLRISNQFHGFFHNIAHMGSLHDISSKIRDIEARIKQIEASGSFQGPGHVHSHGEGSSSSPSGVHHGTPHALKEDEIVGFDEPREKLIRQLIEEESRELTISVVGPGGSGKSVLLKSVYDSKEVQKRFDGRAWVHVSSSFKREEIISGILKQIAAKPKPAEEATPREGVDKLNCFLQEKRYVIVFDDIWRTDDWECIRKLLHNCSRGSRIIVSTRKSDVASCCVESPRYIHQLESLAWPDAWGLFCKKAFPNSHGMCPAELEEWSRKIVWRCEGLPLAIIVVGSLLSKKPQFPNEWKKLYDSLGSEIGNNSNLSIISRTLQPSYKDLPSHLKSCFLYFSIFPEDHPIEHARLIRLWVAEGFVMKARGKTPEQVAEDCLNELIGRNLVHASKLDFDGRVRSCRVLNLVLEFIVSMSEDENFVSILSGQNMIPGEKGRRLSIRDACAIAPHSRSFSGVRSTFFFRSDNFPPSDDIGKFIHDFKYLRVLDLQDAPLDKFPEYVVHLSLLRYLSLRRTNIKSVPKSIEKLSYLETLDLKQTDVTELPETIKKLVHLRHLLVYRYNVISYVTLDSVRGVKLSTGIGGLTALQKLSIAKPDKHRRIIKELGELTQLRKLGLIEVKREDEKDLRASIQKMQNLSTLDLSLSINESLDLDNLHSPPRYLQRLYLKGQLHSFPRWISSLNNLLRIGLKWSRLKCSPLKALHDLPNLMVLELVDVCSEDELVFEAGKFRKLKILHIEQFIHLHTLVVQERAMPELQRLTLCNCQSLKMLPLGINYLAHLKELILYGMHKDFIALLQKTREDRQMVSHIPVIHSYTLGSSQYWSFQNLS